MKWAGFARPFESNPGSPQKREAFVGGVSRSDASSFAPGGKGTKTPPKNPWFLGISFSPLCCASFYHRRVGIERTAAPAPGVTPCRGGTLCTFCPHEERLLRWERDRLPVCKTIERRTPRGGSQRQSEAVERQSSFKRRRSP